MSEAKATKPKKAGRSQNGSQDNEPKPMIVQAAIGETEAETMARVMVKPYFRHGIVANAIADKMVNQLPHQPRFDDYGKVIKATAETTGKGDLAMASELLTAQALSLDTIFTEMTRRATMNMGDYPLATERYARLAFKAQSNCRATLEALAKLHQPREQTVRHVHVNDGGQAVIADQFHHHQGGGKNGKAVKQSDATGAVGEHAALPRPDPLGNGMPIPDREREAEMQNARRDESGST